MADTEEPLSLKQLLVALRQDTQDYAAAELAFLKAELKVRRAIALPALGLIGAALLLVCGAITALLIGLILLLTTSIGMMGAIFCVTSVAVLIAFILLRVALKRLMKAFEYPKDSGQ